MDRKALEQNYQKTIGASLAAELEQNYQRSGIDSLVQAVKKATQYNPSAPSTQPTQAAPAGASSRKQSDTMKDQLDAIKEQRDDAAIKAGAYMRAGNMQQRAKEQQKIANKAAIEYENAYTQWKNQRNAEAVEDYNPDENKFKARDAALAGVQNAFQSMRQYAAAASSYLSGNPEAQAWEAKALMEKGVDATEAVKQAGLTDKREIPITDYKTQAELRHEKNVASVGAVEGGALQLVNTISNMVPSLVANAILPGSGLPMMAASAAGNKYADAYEKYGNTDTAFVLGSAAGGASMLTEQFGGLYGSLGKTAAGQAVAKKLMAEAPGLYSLANSVGGKWLRDALSEGIEEGAEDVINYAIEKALTGDSDEMDNFGYDILLGALAGGVLGGGNAAMRSITYNRVGKALNASPTAVAQQVQEGMEKGAGTAPAIYASEVRKNPNNQMVGRLYEANLTYDAESGLSKIQNDITQVSIKEIKAMVSKADALAQAAQKLNVEATPQAVATAITDAQRTQSIKTAEDSVGQSFAAAIDNPANAGEKAYNSALAGVAANQGVAARINNDPVARQAFSQLTGVQFTGNTAQDIAAIEVATQNIAKSGKQAISQAEYAQRVTAAGEQAAAQFDADMQAQAEQMRQESQDRWLSVEQNTITDVDGKRHIKEITNTDMRGNTEIGYKRAEIPSSKKKAAAEVDNAAKYLGKTIVWYEGALQVNGQYRLSNGFRAPDGTIYVNINAQNPLMVTFGHEMFHDLVTDGKYAGMIDTLVENPDYADMVKGMMNAKTELYERNGIELDPNAAAEEVAADISGDLLGSRDMLEYIGARNTEAATGIKGFLNRILKKLKGKPSAQEAYNRLSETQRALIDGMEGRVQDATAEANARYSIYESYVDDISQWVRDGKPNGMVFVLGNTGPVLQGLGAIESDIYLTSDKLNVIQKDHPEVSDSTIKKIPQILEDPILILRSKGHGKSGSNSRMVVIGAVKADNGQPLLTILDLRPYEKGFLVDDMQKVNSAYTKKNPENFIRGSEIVYADKNRTVPLLRRIGLTIASRELQQSGSIGRITYNGNGVNISGVPFSDIVPTDNYSMQNSAEDANGEHSLMDIPAMDSTGRELSAEQREYFFGSKVVDAEGRLKPVYHGSPAVFTEFSPDFMSQHGSSEGQGFYFTDYKPMAEGYQKDGGQLLEGYLDIKKPLSDSEITLTRAEVKKLLQAVDPTGDEVLVNYDPAGGMGYPSKAWYNRALDATVKAAMDYSDSDSEILAEIANGGAGTGAVLEAARNTLGYDGYIVEGKYDNATVYVAFDGNQFKNIDNATPTESKDIRYSLMEDAQYMADIDKAVSEATAKADEALKAAQAEVKNLRQQLADYRHQATAEAKETAAWKDGEAKLISDLSEAQSKEKKARALASYMDEYNAISERYRGEVRATDSEALAQYSEKLSDLRSGFRGEMEKLAIEQGAFKRGEKPARDIYVPTSVNGQKVTRGTRTILEASQTPESMLEEHAKEILAGARGYEVISDKKAQEYAERIIDKDGYDKADELFTNAMNGDQVLDKKTLVLGEYLYMEAAKAGDVKNAMRYAADVAAAATRAGQVVQAMRVLKKATPTGKLYYLNRMVDTMNKNIVDNGGEPIQIDEGLARKLLEAENIKDPKEQGKAVDETIDEIEQNIADQIPATAWDKWNAWRYLSMLGNIRTQVRNVVGNAAFMPLVATKNLLAAGMEKAFIRNGGRTKSAFLTTTNAGKRLMEFGKKDFDTVVDEIQGGGKYNQSSSIEEKRTIFKSKAIEGWRKLTNKAMDKGDEIFSKHHYARALAGYLYANHLDYDKITRNTPQAQEVLNKARTYAILEAQKATFRDANQLASFINKTKRSLLKKAQTAETKGAKAGWYAGTAIAEGIMPFTKTPIDILARGVEYSPIGLIKGIKEAVYDVKKGNKTAAEAIDTLSAGLTGTGIFALGYFLQSLGLLAGALDDDKEAKYRKDRGAQGFALHIGDKYYTIDWLAPFSLPLFTGAAVAETVENGDEVSFATLADVFSTISEPMLEMSMLQGVNSALSNGQYSSDSKIVSFMTNQITGYLSQANPTILGQIARAVDDTSRNAYYYDPNYKGFVQTGKVFGDKQLAKVPFASKALTSRIDLWGNKQENTGGSFFGRLAYNMLSPGYYSEESSDPVDVALTKLYEETEDTAVLPSKPSKTVTNNKTDYKMNAKQYEEYCIVKGQTAHKEIQTFINSAEYKKMSNEDRVDILEHLYKYSTYKAQKNLLGDKYVASSTYSRCVKAEAYAKGGNPVYKYFIKD